MNWKKPKYALLVSILIFGITLTSVYSDPQPPKLFVDPPEYNAAKLGETFTIDINISNVQDLKGFELKLGYNTTLLDALDAVVGPFPQPLSWIVVEIHEPEGYVSISAISVHAADGNGTLATITFNATYAESASCTLDLYDTKLFNSDGELVTHDVEDGNYKFVFLSITLATDKLTYHLGENVTVYGNVTLDGSPHQGFVALEVDDPGNYGIVRRTLQTGIAPPPGNITIFDVFPSDMFGKPKESFRIGTLAYFNVTVRNNGTEWKNVAITVNVYDGNMVPLGAPSDYTAIGPGISSFISPIDIPSWAYIGTGTAYASAFTDLPRVGGVPYCPEKSTTFQITSSTQGATTLETQSSGSNQSIGNYSLTFKLAPDARIGIYRVYASAIYKEQSVMSNTTIELELVGDVNGNCFVGSDDIIIIQKTENYGKTPAEAANPNCDVNGNNFIGSDDIIIIQKTENYGSTCT